MLITSLIEHDFANAQQQEILRTARRRRRARRAGR
jgi:hypothetical protein